MHSSKKSTGSEWCSHWYMWQLFHNVSELVARVRTRLNWYVNQKLLLSSLEFLAWQFYRSLLIPLKMDTAAAEADIKDAIGDCPVCLEPILDPPVHQVLFLAIRKVEGYYQKIPENCCFNTCIPATWKTNLAGLAPKFRAKTISLYINHALSVQCPLDSWKCL